MIVPMKKSSIIILAKDTQNSLKELRRLGVLHIEHHQVPQSKDIMILKEDIILINEAEKHSYADRPLLSFAVRKCRSRS